MAHVMAHDMAAIVAALDSLASRTAELATAADKLADDIHNLRLSLEDGADYERSAA